MTFEQPAIKVFLTIIIIIGIIIIITIIIMTQFIEIHNARKRKFHRTHSVTCETTHRCTYKKNIKTYLLAWKII